ncbi:peptidoglycan DD-metalloendopeptidase family protein [Rufibacter sediminis]|uniref:Peptidoglycan DD-metalloendopeptidase family protein n=1 Tax=Rufibacter sediminis TaxID=2762756 RepID=A0ABR6VNU3_9BACT|nr:peptidoglycan DD-metalloendopeptidase family protein [Rufibacter sediminis]MBC3538582.1 peptidoglycan DD-metalloendopeptidase family protein [Rufibacter sediminis]
MENSSKLITLLAAHAASFAPILDYDLNGDQVTRLDFTAQNDALRHTELRDTAAFETFVLEMLRQKNAQVGVGGYFENRVIYRRSEHFAGPQESRSIHLGVDIWAPAGIPIYAPVAGSVHSFQDNANFGDYGPTILLQHELEGIPFYTLYGHLSRTSLDGLSVGKPFAAGQQVATMGPYPENGDWPPHLHFQLMTDLLGKSGDFPGVCAPSEEAFYRQICLDPNLILQSRHLW